MFKHRYHAINHKGNYLGTLLDKFGWTKTNLRERDLNLRPTDWRGLYQLSYLAIHWRSPYFVNIFVRGGASQKSWNHILPFSQGSRPGYDTTWEEAVGDALWRDTIFFYKYHAINHKGNWLGTKIEKYCWIDWNSAVLCIKRLFHVGVWTFAWFVRPL